MALQSYESVKEQVRAATDIVSLVEESVPLKPQGKDFVGLCPFHNDRKPSMRVSQPKQIYKCFACGAGGDIFTWVMERTGVDFKEALIVLAERAGINVSNLGGQSNSAERQNLLRIHEWAAKVFAKALEGQSGKEALDYLERRGLKKDVIGQFRLGFASDDWHEMENMIKGQNIGVDLAKQAGLLRVTEKTGALRDGFVNRLMFPIFDGRERVIAFGGRTMATGEKAGPKYLNSPESLLFSKKNCLYGLSQARSSIAGEQGYAILVEGYTDVLLMHQFGFTQSVATLGTAFTTEHARALRKLTDKIKVIFDGDSAGLRAAERSIPILLENDFEVKVVVLPEGSDPADLLLNQGREAMVAQLKAAESPVRFAISLLGIEGAVGADEKVQASKKILTWIDSIPDAVRRTLYLRETARALEIPEHVLTGQEPPAKSTTPAPKKEEAKPVEERDSHNAYYLAQDWLLWAVLHKPQLASRLEQEVPLDLIEDPVFREIAEAIVALVNAGEPITSEALIGKAHNEEVKSRILELWIREQSAIETNMALPQSSAAISAPEEEKLWLQCKRSMEQQGNEKRRLMLRTELKEAEDRGDEAAVNQILLEIQKLERNRINLTEKNL